MVARGVYVRPVGGLNLGHRPEADSRSLAVVGRDDLRFAAAEIIERAGASIQHRLMDAEQLLADDALRKTLERVSQPRSAIAGLPVDRPLIMGIVNITPDSFSDGGRYLTPQAAVDHALKLEGEGADILDIGGESTRPGAGGVDLEEESRRVLPVIRDLAKRSPRAPLSIDTRKAEIMRRAALEGVNIINDVSALTHDDQAIAVAASSGLPVVLMHARGDPRTMQNNPVYQHVVLDVYDWLEARVQACEQAGLPRTRLIVDPGIGFGKTLAHNLALLGSLSLFHGLGCPVLLGASRKSFIGRLAGGDTADRLGGSIATALLAASQGVQIVRVHDVAATRQALMVWQGACHTI